MHLFWYHVGLDHLSGCVSDNEPLLHAPHLLLRKNSIAGKYIQIVRRGDFVSAMLTKKIKFVHKH